ncbi:hypothetical protein M0804_002049 [Polistes exclamans]|nr:hypothetical protein M0804_002049 [Polistes exclamans]
MFRSYSKEEIAAYELKKQELRERIKPQCEETAKQYAMCVLEKKTLRKDDCNAEFARFKACIVKAAASKNTRL